jgi:hypothetical protein
LRHEQGGHVSETVDMHGSTDGMRADLSAAHDAVWDGVRAPGSWWTGAERRAAATVVLDAFADPDPQPPWVPASSTITVDGLAPVVVDALHRMTAHASTLTRQWYDALTTSTMSEPAYVELCGIVVSVTAVASLARSLGATLPPLPAALGGNATKHVPELDRSPRNWVPVAAPAATRAPVVEALSAAPGAFALLWDHLAPAQYMADHQMVDLAWTRGTLSRPQMELVAARVSLLRQCFF